MRSGGAGRRGDLDVFDVGLAAFRQKFGNGPQRRRLGIDLSHTDALRVMGDPNLLEAEYDAWLERTGRPPRAEADATAQPRRWFRWRR